MSPKRGEIAWRDVEDALSMPDEIESYLHRETGAVVAFSTSAYAEDDEEEARERVEADPAYTPIPREDSDTSYRDMAAFAETVHEGDLREKLDDALGGRGAFGRFRNVLRAHPDLQQRFDEHRRAARIGRLRAWMKDADITLELVVDPVVPRRTAAGAPPSAPAKTPRPGLVELLMLGGKPEYIGGAVRRHLFCDSASEARAAFKRIAREIVEGEGIGWRKRYVEGTSELRMGRYLLRHEERHVELHVETPKEVYLGFSE